MPDPKKNIRDFNSWQHFTDLNKVEIVCHSADEVIAAYNALTDHKMIKGILRVNPRFDTDFNEVVVNFDYFFIMICEARIRLMDAPPL